ncbi:MAG: tetratricopeptide repeat protein [Bacteroidota bacterium]
MNKCFTYFKAGLLTTILMFNLHGGLISQGLPPDYQDIKDDIYSCNLNSAREKTDDLLAEDSSNPYATQLKFDKIFVDIMLFGQENLKETWLTEIGEATSVIENSSLPLLRKHLLLSNLFLQDCVIQMDAGNQLRAVSSFKTGFKHYESLKDAAEKPVGLKKIQGLYEIFAGMVPDEYQWVKKLLGLRGDYEQGLHIFRQYLDDCRHAGDYYEAAFYYALFSAFLTDEPDEGWSYYSANITKHRASPLFRLGYAMLGSSVGNTKEALKILQDNYDQQGDTRLLLLDFQIGSFLLYQLDESGKSYLNRFLQTFPGSNHKLQAWNLLYQFSAFTDNPSEKTKSRQSLVQMAEADKKMAEQPVIREINSGIPLLKPLCGASLLYNGGYYREAKQQLITGTAEITNSPHKKHKLEFYYRMGRIADKLSETSSAKKYYIKTIALGKHETWYFAPLAALKLAEIYEDNSELAEAKQYFELCLDINKGDYQADFQRQAKAGLQRIGNKDKL